eukprot:CAMPEP_0116870324 /NCGR_PEP_ID=MMETSP0463-20121206/202_1 /TAXON_ID=181622 /ORGANISM="Strombidinopsis sp, Strain SopsisLIS2011" /LENGTH=42 /DNA_ID= /DNA_START= /DNA_END= /DNA_ORIENTATION=
MRKTDTISEPTAKYVTAAPAAAPIEDNPDVVESCLLCGGQAA